MWQVECILSVRAHLSIEFVLFSAKQLPYIVKSTIYRTDEYSDGQHIKTVIDSEANRVPMIDTGANSMEGHSADARLPHGNNTLMNDVKLIYIEFFQNQIIQALNHIQMRAHHSRQITLGKNRNMLLNRHAKLV